MPFELYNRRYTGSKLKISDWICDLILEKCQGQNAVDLFAGTAIIASKILPYFNEIVLNDTLYSNEVIYRAFFKKGSYDGKKLEKINKEYLRLKPDGIRDNYVSESYGGRFFSKKDAKQIGYIRENIEKRKKNFTDKEYYILLASLLYSLDRCANTVGHYDAYIKGRKVFKPFEFDLIQPFEINGKKISIYREDANELVKKIKADVIYIDPPYNSRQYSRFYHVLENIARWKKPELFGVARKPLAENMSEYCRSSASKSFQDLINNIDCKYIVVSYNNTYDSKSKSSRNKIEHSLIRNILNKRGKTVIFNKKHSYFNAGKTEFADHQEYVFISKVGGKNGRNK